MKNGSFITDSSETQAAHIKKRYQNNFTDIQPEQLLQDIATLLKIIENSATDHKDPRTTIELAKLRKENQSLKKELTKFFPSKNSIEATSKKLEHLFKIDTASLIRYENSDLKEKNEKLIVDSEKTLKKFEENAQKLKETQENCEKLKEISAELRVENTNLMLKNRELQKKVKVFEEQNGIMENLQKKMRSVLVEADKSKGFGRSVDVQTEEDFKGSKLMARLEQKKKTFVLEVEPQLYVWCAGQGRKVLKVTKTLSICVKNEGIKGKSERKVLKVEKQGKLLCKPAYDKVGVVQVASQSAKKSAYLAVEQEISLSCRPKNIKTPVKSKKLRVLPEIYLEILPIVKALKIFSESTIKIDSQPKKVKPLTLQKSSSIVVKAKIRSKESLLLPKKPKLSVSKTTSASLQGKPKRKLMISKPSTASLLPAPKPKKSKKLKICFESLESILPTPEPLSLCVKSVYNTKESEEFEVFNAANLYKPQLSASDPISSSYIPTKPSLSLEKFSMRCRKHSQKLKLAKFTIFERKEAKISFQNFSILHKTTFLEIQVLRRLGYVPENKVTDDEEAKSPAGGRRKARTPVRKPAIEEYFNLVFDI